MRKRLRPAWSPDELAALYPVPHDHTRWPDHVVRVAETIDVANVFAPPRVIADLSCGDGAIALAIGRRYFDMYGQAPVIQLGDLAPGHPYHGPIETTILSVSDVDLFVCCETLEHVNDPDGLLAAIRYRSKALLLSTPFAETVPNPEHYWAWDDIAVRDMLLGAGFTPVDFRLVDHPLARYQIWACV